MRKSYKKILALTLAAAMASSSAVFAEDSVTLAQQPSATADNKVTSGNNTISDLGPAGEQKVEFVNSGPGVSLGGGQQTTDQTTSSPDKGTAGTTGTSAPTQATIDSSVAKPTVSAQGAVLYDATHNQILFEKNSEQQFSPASITKLMTALLVAENKQLTDTVTYNSTAVTGLESGATTIGLVAGDTMTVQDSLYALLLKSACDVANGLAESVSGSMDAFVAKMNEKAKALGCKNTTFGNPSGLNVPGTNQTTPYDMALIANAAFSNETVAKIAGTKSYKLPATSKRGATTITNGNKMLDTYSGIIGGKTGYTSKAGNTLVEVAERDGIKLIAVVMKANSSHYTDAKKMLDYGYQALGITKGSTETSGKTESAGTDGWKQTSDGHWTYVSNGEVVKGKFLTISNNTYYLGSDGYMITGWQKFSNGSYYYFDKSTGVMKTNTWITDTVDGKQRSYYVQADGTMARAASEGELLTVETSVGTYQVDYNGVCVKQLS